MEYSKNAVKISDVDSARINRLLEESIAHFKEMNLIFERILGDGLISKRNARSTETGDTKKMKIISIDGVYPYRTITYDNGDVICYNEVDNVCEEGPC